jgi:peptidoglycan-associated lipoprotein
MKKQLSSTLTALTLIAVILVTGCKSPGRNPAGVYGNDVTGIGGIGGVSGIIPMADRFSGGNEYRGMFSPVLFAYDSSQVGATERPKVELVAGHLKQNPAVAVIIEGHCDERGSREYNLALGERRAQAVRAYLAELGIEADRIQTKSLGEESPAMPGHDERAWSQNRRGEFVLYY